MTIGCKFTGIHTASLDDKDPHSIQLGHIKKRAMISLMNWYACNLTSVAVRQAFASHWAQKSFFFRFSTFRGEISELFREQFGINSRP